jgi:FixJ family two-component response regulator
MFFHARHTTKNEALCLCTDHIASIVDDAAVRVATASLVRSFGWQVHTFASAEAFLHFGPIAETLCLISDVQMPNISGIEMHERLLELGCAPPTIFITAFATVALQAKCEKNGALAFLEKPIDAAAMERYLNLALAKRLGDQ